MMNLFQLQEQLKDFSKDQLVREMQSPSGSAPPFLIMTELQRRTRMENAAALDKGPPTSTVAQDAVNAAGVPQGGIADMARAMAPQTNMTQNTGAMTPQAGVAPQGAAPVQAMQEGGLAGISRDVRDYYSQEAADMALDNRMNSDARASAVDRGPSAFYAAKAAEGRATPEDLALLDRQARSAGMDTDVFIQAILTGDPEAPPELGPYAMDQMIAGPMSGKEIGAGPADVTLPDRLLMGQRGAGAADFTPQPETPTGLGGLGDIIARTRATEQAADIGARRGPPEQSAPGPVNAVDVRDGFQPATMGPTELNTPAMIAALRGPEPVAPSAYRSMDEMTAPEDTRFSDALSRRPGIRNLGERLMDDVQNTAAAVLSPFASEEAESIAAPEPPVLTPEPPSATTTAPSGTASGATVGGMAVPPPQTDEDRMLQQDKWLALARFGAALASSQAPTFGQAFGQATQVGLDALGQARQDFLERKKAADDMAVARATLAARMAGRGDSGSDPQLGLSASAARGLSALDDEIARTQQAMMEAEAAIADSTGIFARPSAEQVQAYNTLRDRAGVLETQRSAITRFGAGLPPSSGVAPPPPIGYDIRD